MKIRSFNAAVLLGFMNLGRGLSAPSRNAELLISQERRSCLFDRTFADAAYLRLCARFLAAV